MWGYVRIERCEKLCREHLAQDDMFVVSRQVSIGSNL